MERELTQSRVTVVVVVGAVATDHRVKVLEPLAARQRDTLHFLFEKVVLVEYQEEVHVLEDGVSDDALEEFPGE